MRSALALLLVTGCGFQVTGGATPSDGGDDAPAGDAGPDAAPADAAIDAPPPPPAPCAAAPDLLLCLSFDAPTFGATMANEGSAQVSANLTNVTRTTRGTGGAAQVGATSLIRIPTNTVLAGIATYELWIRLDADPATGQRVGITDAENATTSLSLFYYNESAGKQLRFELGVQLTRPVTLVLGQWHHIASVCSGGTLTGYVDGVAVGTAGGCAAGAGNTDGLQIGQNNTGTSGDQPMTGALDEIRGWTTPLTPAQICAHAGKPSC